MQRSNCSQVSINLEKEFFGTVIKKYTGVQQIYTQNCEISLHYQERGKGKGPLDGYVHSVRMQSVQLHQLHQ